MSGLLIVLLVVVVVMCLAMWAVYYIPFPPGSPTFLKPILYVIILVVGVIIILMKSGLAHAIHHAGTLPLVGWV